jgi:toxin ParE1/3/4
MKKREVVYLQKSQEDIDDITYYMGQDNFAASEAFIDAVEATCELLTGSPDIGSTRHFRNPRFSGLRMFPVKKFDNYLIFYQATEKELLIVRVLHGARDLAALFEKEEDQ